MTMTTIDQFCQKHGPITRSINDIIDRWVLEKQVRDFLSAKILGGIMVVDLLVGDGLVDNIPPDVKTAFVHLMGVHAETRAQVEQLILEKFPR